MTTNIRWGSIDPIMGLAKTYPESQKIEEEFLAGKESMFIDTFSITINLN